MEMLQQRANELRKAISEINIKDPSRESSNELWPPFKELVSNAREENRLRTRASKFPQMGRVSALEIREKEFKVVIKDCMTIDFLFE